MVELFEFTRAHPDCTHCGSVERAVTIWPQSVHDSCPCVCHRDKSTRVKEELKKAKKGRRKRV